jgi:hypothetical protein
VKLGYFFRTAYRALTTAKRGPTFYDLCDPVLGGASGGDPHIRKFYNGNDVTPQIKRNCGQAHNK